MFIEGHYFMMLIEGHAFIRDILILEKESLNVCEIKLHSFVKIENDDSRHFDEITCEE